MKSPLVPVVLGLVVATTAPGAAPAAADLVQTVDGKWQGQPRAEGDVPLGPNDEPPADMLRQTADSRVEATYETVKMKGWSSPAGLVKRILSSDQAAVESFAEGFRLADANYFKEAADQFHAAAGETADFAKQQALYFRMQALQAEGNAEGTRAAIDELLAAFPSSFYFADAQILRAKIDSADAAAVEKHLNAIKSAKGMNLRDVYRAEYMRILMLLERARKHAEALKAYDDLVKQIEKGDAVAGATVKQLALVGMGNALMRSEPPRLAEAEAAFRKAATEGTDADVLAGAYLGLGNLAFGAAKDLQNQKKLPEAQAKLTEATQHYLRVTLLYADLATEVAPILDAFENQAKAFVAIFQQSGGKDCLAADRAYKAYYELHGRLTGADQKRIAREARDFNDERKKQGCK